MKCLTREDFLPLYEQGLNDVEIAEKLGFSKHTVGIFRRRLLLPAIQRGLSEDEKAKIKQLHGEGLSIRRIAEELHRSYRTVFVFCRNEGLDTSKASRLKKSNEEQRLSVLAYLKEHGPTSQRDLVSNLSLDKQGVKLRKIRTVLFDQLEVFRFKVGRGSGGSIKYRSEEVYDGLSVLFSGPIYAVRDDPRIIGYVAERVPFKVESGHDAQALVMHLKKQLGYDRARQVVQKLGYKYRQPFHKAPKKKGPAFKFTDEQLRSLHSEGLSDKQIAEKLAVSTQQINTRRNRLGLPSTWGKAREQLRVLYEKGLTDKQMAEELSVSVISIILRRNKIGLPPNRGALRMLQDLEKLI